MEIFSGFFSFCRKKSELTVSVTSLDDAGSYECRVKNKVDKQTVSKFSKVIVQPAHWTLSVDSNRDQTPCNQSLAESYCHNGATCFFFSDLGEVSCE